MAVGSSGGAGSIRAGRAHVELSAKDAGLQKALDHVERRMKAIAKVAATMTLAIAGVAAAAAAAIGAGLVTALKSAVDHFDKTKKAADRLGTSTDKISALGYAAEQSGASLEEMESAAKFLQRNLETNADTFKEFGLDAAKLKTLGLDEQMAAVADAIAAMPNATERTAAAMALLGRGGTSLLPLFKDGGAGLRALLHEAKDIGAIVDPAKAAEAERIADAVDRSWKSIVSTFRFIGSKLFNTEGFETFSKAIVLSLKYLREDFTPHVIELAHKRLPELSDSLGKTWDGFKNAVQGGDIELAMRVLGSGIEVEFRKIAVMSTDIWNSMKDEIVDGWHSMVTELKVLMVDYLRWWQKTVKDNIPKGVLDRARNAGLMSNLMDINLPSEKDIRNRAAADELKRRADRARDYASAIQDLADAQDRLNNIQREARAGNTVNPVMLNAIALGQLAVSSSLAAMRNRPGASMGASSTQGSFSTFAAQQSLGIGTVGDKIVANGKTTNNILQRIEQKIGPAEFL